MIERGYEKNDYYLPSAAADRNGGWRFCVEQHWARTAQCLAVVLRCLGGCIEWLAGGDVAELRCVRSCLLATGQATLQKV